MDYQPSRCCAVAIADNILDYRRAFPVQIGWRTFGMVDQRLLGERGRNEVAHSWIDTGLVSARITRMNARDMYLSGVDDSCGGQARATALQHGFPAGSLSRR